MHLSSRLPSRLDPNAWSELLEALVARGEDLVDLTASNPTRCGVTYPIEAILTAMGTAAILDYAPDPAGSREAREAIAAYHGHGLGPGDLVLSASTSEAYAWLFKLLGDPGDEILVPSPSYPLFDWLARLEGLQARMVPAYFHERWHLDVDALADACGPRTRAVVVVNPNNPTGQFLSQTEWRRLTTVCGRRGLALIVDEVFAGYPLEAPSDRLATALEAQDPPCPLVVLSGLSKVAALPQLKLGWMAFRGVDGPALRERILFVADQYLSVGTAPQAAVPCLLREAPGIQAGILRRLRANLAELDRSLVPHPHLARLPVEGGWSVLLRRPALGTDAECALQILERTGVLVHPGHLFDLPGERFLVLSLLPPEARFAEGLRRMLPLLAS